jgi:hypothetical protein
LLADAGSWANTQEAKQVTRAMHDSHRHVRDVQMRFAVDCLFTFDLSVRGMMIAMMEEVFGNG